MSKQVLAVASLAALYTVADAKLYIPGLKPQLFDEEGSTQQRPTAYHSNSKSKLRPQTYSRGKVGMFEEEEESQKLKLNMKKIVKGINTGLDLYGKAKGVGLFDEDEEELLPNGLPKRCLWDKSCAPLLNGKGKDRIYDEEEGFYWAVDGSASNKDGEQIWDFHRSGSKGMDTGVFDEASGEWWVGAGYNSGTGANVGAGVTIRWEDLDEEEAQKLHVDLRKATKTLVAANKMGLLEEDADMDEVQKLKLGKVIKGAVKVVKVAGAVGLLEEDEEFQKTNVLDALDKALDLYGKAKQVGLFEEEPIVGGNPCTYNYYGAKCQQWLKAQGY